jgi:hypothetical protein
VEEGSTGTTRRLSNQRLRSERGAPGDKTMRLDGKYAFVEVASHAASTGRGAIKFFSAERQGGKSDRSPGKAPADLLRPQCVRHRSQSPLSRSPLRRCNGS